MVIFNGKSKNTKILQIIFTTDKMECYDQWCYTYVKGMLFQSQLCTSIIVEYIEKNICDWFDSMSEQVVESLLFIIILNC